MTRAALARALLAGALAGAAVLFLTRAPGPGLDPDSASYLGAGESLARHAMLATPMADALDADSTSPLHHYPPAFPAVIAIGVRAGASPVQAGRAVLAASAFMTAATLVAVVNAAAGAMAGAGLLVLLLLLPSLFTVHASVLSEPLFLACMALTLAAMAVRPRRPLAYGVPAALAVLVRYAGIGVPVAAVAWAWLQDGTRRERIVRAIWAGVPTLVLEGAWQIRLRLLELSMPEPSGLGDVGASLRDAAVTFTDQLVPWTAPHPLRLVAAAALAIVIATMVGRAVRATADGTTARRVLTAALTLTAALAATLAYARLTVGDQIPFDDRILSPYIVLGAVLTATAVGLRWPTWRTPMRTGAALVAITWLALARTAFAFHWHQARVDGLDLAQVWRVRSPLRAWLQTEGRTHALFSNSPMVIYLATGRPSRELPDALNADSVAAFGRQLHAERGVVVEFREGYRDMVPGDSLARRLGLAPAGEWPEGRIWIAQP